LEGIQVSNDGGETWNPIDDQFQTSPPSGRPFFERSDINPQGAYDVYIRVDPSNFDHMIVGGIHIWSTRDGGHTWDENPSNIHVDQHDVAFAPSDPSTVYAG